MGKGGGGKGSEEVMRRKKEGEQCLTLAHQSTHLHTMSHTFASSCCVHTMLFTTSGMFFPVGGACFSAAAVCAGFAGFLW